MREPTVSATLLSWNQKSVFFFLSNCGVFLFNSFKEKKDIFRCEKRKFPFVFSWCFSKENLLLFLAGVSLLEQKKRMKKESDTLHKTSECKIFIGFCVWFSCFFFRLEYTLNLKKKLRKTNQEGI